MEGNVSFLKSNDFLLRIAEGGHLNDFSSDYTHRSINGSTALNYNIYSNAVASLGIEFNAESLNKSVDKVIQSITDFNVEKIYQHSNFDIFFKFNQNSFNSRYYPTSGNHLQFFAKLY